MGLFSKASICKVIFILSLSLLAVSCRKPTVNEILQTATWSVMEACSIEWLNSEQCNIFDNSIAVAKSFTSSGDVVAQRFALKVFFQDEINKLPKDSRLIPYYQWAVDFLGVVDTKFKAN